MPKRHTIPSGGPPLFYTVFPSPFRLLGVAATAKGICRVQTNLPSEAAFVRLLQQTYQQIPTKKPGEFKSLKKEFDLYFQGKLNKFTCGLDLKPDTPFQRKVWRALLTIPYGQTRSYRWVAQTIRNPKAVRAVGNANGNNPVSIIVPCHRVIQSNGHLGGYTGGIHIKRKLLDLESGQDGVV